MDGSIEMFMSICDELNIKCTILSKDWVFMLEKDGITRFFVGSKSGINNYALGRIVDDKYALYSVLKAKGLPVAEYNIVYGENNKYKYAIGCNSLDYVKKYFDDHNCEIVLKPNCGTCGNDVYRVKDVTELEEIYYKLTNRYFSISMSPFYHIKNEYRLIVLDGEVRGSYKKIRPIVYGDGIHSIKELLIDFNSNYFEKKLNDSIYDRVLNDGEKYEYSWKFNLSLGAISSEITDKVLLEKLESIALTAAKEVGLRFGSIDIIITEDDELLIIEMNSGVMLYEKTKPLYKEVILKMFE